MSSKPLQVFEYTHLLIDDRGFNRRHWTALGKYNELHGGKYFSLTPNGVRFNQYVGVIQVDDLTIEILPKIGKTETDENKAKWQKVLIDMLRECRWMQIYANEKAALRFKPHSILEAYLELFILECEIILREGLVKKYRTIGENCDALKGKLMFAKQIQQNLIHQERFYTKHTIFDRENLYNRILLKALKIIPYLTQSPFLNDRVSNLLLAFPELQDVAVTPHTFECLIYNRKTNRYKEALEIAAMLLLNYRPDISHGHNHILAILFDMNDLWEEYVYRQLSKNKPEGWSVRPQNRKPFWQPADSNSFKTIRPDMVLQTQLGEVITNIILDTKWKQPQNNIPDDADLKQMFVYNEYWESKAAYLVYPESLYSEQPISCEGKFMSKLPGCTTHGCGILRISVMNEKNDTLDKTIGKRLIDFIDNTCFKDKSGPDLKLINNGELAER
ncbi:MAG: restriction endonuclease [Bacteroidia bacterium]|nr:restriction endonuclease [Bacteroidia bacterium]